MGTKLVDDVARNLGGKIFSKDSTDSRFRWDLFEKFFSISTNFTSVLPFYRDDAGRRSLQWVWEDEESL